MEQERLQQEAELNQKVNEEEVQSSLTACRQRERTLTDTERVLGCRDLNEISAVQQTKMNI